MYPCKVEGPHSQLQRRWSAYLPFCGRESVGGNTTIVCDTRATPDLRLPSQHTPVLIRPIWVHYSVIGFNPHRLKAPKCDAELCAKSSSADRLFHYQTQTCTMPCDD